MQRSILNTETIDNTKLWRKRNPELDLSHPIEFEGVAFKKTSHPDGFEKRYFLIKDHYLLYKRSSDTHKISGVLDLFLATARFHNLENNCENLSMKISIGRGSRVTSLYIESQEEAESWKNVLSQHCLFNNFWEEYEHEGWVSKGATAVVFKVKHISSGRLFAAKSFAKSELMKKERSKIRLLSEIRINRKLKHKSIVPLHKVYETPEQVILLFDLIQGGPLFSNGKEVRNNPLNLNQIKKIIFELLKIIQYLQTEKIIHRDLKPMNVLITKNFEVKLIDFGLSVDIENFNFESYRIGGTPGYIAPEMFEVRENRLLSNLTSKVDIFSIGVIFYYYLFGCCVFRGNSAQETLLHNKECDLDVLGEEDMIQFRNGEDPTHCLSAYDLCLMMLEIEQRGRPSVDKALKHHFFDDMEKGKELEFEIFDSLIVSEEEAKMFFKVERHLGEERELKLMKKVDEGMKNKILKKSSRVRSTHHGEEEDLSICEIPLI